MRLFAVDMYDERINAVQNQAGRLAFNVLALLILLIALFTTDMGNAENWFTYALFAILGVSLAVELIIERRGGMDSTERDEQIRQLGKKGRIRSYRLRKMAIQSCIPVVLLCWLAVSLDATPALLVIPAVILALPLIYIFLADNKKLYGSYFPRHGKREHTDGNVSVFIERDMFDERIRAVHNRAGRIAWDVLVSLLMIVLLTFSELTKPPDIGFFSVMMLPIILSWLVAYGIERRNGITMQEIKQYIEHLRDKKRYIKKFLRTWFWMQFGLVSCFTVLRFPHDDPSTYDIAIHMSIVLTWFSILMVLGRSTLREQLGLTPKEFRALLTSSKAEEDNK